MCIMIGLHWCPVQDIKAYNPPNYFFALLLNKTDHVSKVGRWLSDDIRRLIWNPSSDFIPRN